MTVACANGNDGGRNSCQFVNVVLVVQLWILRIYNSGAVTRIEVVRSYLVWSPCASFLVPCSCTFLGRVIWPICRVVSRSLNDLGGGL